MTAGANLTYNETNHPPASWDLTLRLRCPWVLTYHLGRCPPIAPMVRLLTRNALLGEWGIFGIWVARWGSALYRDSEMECRVTIQEVSGP